MFFGKVDNLSLKFMFILTKYALSVHFHQRNPTAKITKNSVVPAAQLRCAAGTTEFFVLKYYLAGSFGKLAYYKMGRASGLSPGAEAGGCWRCSSSPPTRLRHARHRN